MKSLTNIFFTLLVSLVVLTACDKDPDPNGNTNNITVPETGILEVEFRLPGSWLPPNRVLRADLSIAKNAEDLYRGHFLRVENVYNTKLNYQVKLSPGHYYYKAGIVCVAGGDSCSAAGFPGGQFGMKWAIGTANVQLNETVHVVPQFTQ